MHGIYYVSFFKKFSQINNNIPPIFAESAKKNNIYFEIFVRKPLENFKSILTPPPCLQN